MMLWISDSRAGECSDLPTNRDADLGREAVPPELPAAAEAAAALWGLLALGMLKSRAPARRAPAASMKASCEACQASPKPSARSSRALPSAMSAARASSGSEEPSTNARRAARCSFGKMAPQSSPATCPRQSSASVQLSRNRASAAARSAWPQLRSSASFAMRLSAVPTAASMSRSPTVCRSRPRERSLPRITTSGAEQRMGLTEVHATPHGAMQWRRRVKSVLRAPARAWPGLGVPWRGGSPCHRVKPAWHPGASPAAAAAQAAAQAAAAAATGLCQRRRA
mmetsp:Transcript_73508/g.227002  ORF Transcript_73508/g.227002 Transcript_73508/m.227002 type:complete len:282 (-) Transcript_73508:97-942(-)